MEGENKYMKQTLTEQKEKMDTNTIIVEDFNTSFSVMDRTTRQCINKERKHLNTPASNS